MRNTTTSSKPKWTATITRNAEQDIAQDISLTDDTKKSMPTPFFPSPRHKSSFQRSPRSSFPTSGSKPTRRPPKPLPVSDIPTVAFSVTNEVFTTAWSLFIKNLVAKYHGDLATATTPQLKRNTSRCFDADVCTLLDVYETHIQDALCQPLGGRVFMDLGYRRFAKTVGSTYSWRSASDVSENAERNIGDGSLSVFQLRYLLAQGLDRYMASPHGFLRRAIANRDEELAHLLKVDIETRKNDLERRASGALDLREQNILLEWVRSVSSTEDEYWDIVDGRKVTGKRASGDEGEEKVNRKRLNEEPGGTGYKPASEIDGDEDIPSKRLERNDSVIRQQFAKEGGCFPGPDEVADDDENEDYYTADEGDADEQKANNRTNSNTECGWNGATEEAYGTHSDEETLVGSAAPRRSSRKGSSPSSSDEAKV